MAAGSLDGLLDRLVLVGWSSEQAPRISASAGRNARVNMWSSWPLGAAVSAGRSVVFALVVSEPEGRRPAQAQRWAPPGVRRAWHGPTASLHTPGATTSRPAGGATMLDGLVRKIPHRPRA